MDHQFQAVANMADWPPNVAGKATQAAVFGVYHPTKGRSAEMLWTGQFPDLQPALYWAAKKEIEAVRKGKWIMASRVVWQHDLAPEKAVEVAVKQMAPQVDLALRGVASDSEEIDIGTGPLRTKPPTGTWKSRRPTGRTQSRRSPCRRTSRFLIGRTCRSRTRRKHGGRRTTRAPDAGRRNRARQQRSLRILPNYGGRSGRAGAPGARPACRFPAALNRSIWVVEELLEGCVGVAAKSSSRKGGDPMGAIRSKRRVSAIMGRIGLPLLALVLLCTAGRASALPNEEDLPQGRLGYKWVPDPPSRPLTPQEELGVQVAKYGGGGLIVMWLLRRMFSQE